VPHEALLHPKRRAHIVNERSVGVAKRMPAHSYQPYLFTRRSQVVFLDHVASSEVN
jgi:hypothetical protein